MKKYELEKVKIKKVEFYGSNPNGYYVFKIFPEKDIELRKEELNFIREIGNMLTGKEVNLM